MTERKEGWAKLLNAAKWHYFQSDGKSLCGRWLVMGTPQVDTENDPTIKSKDNCSACYKKLMTLETKK